MATLSPCAHPVNSTELGIHPRDDSPSAIGLLSKAERSHFQDLCRDLAQKATTAGDECSVSADSFGTRKGRANCEFEIVLRIDASAADPSDPAEICRSMVLAMQRAAKAVADRLDG